MNKLITVVSIASLVLLGVIYTTTYSKVYGANPTDKVNVVDVTVKGTKQEVIDAFGTGPVKVLHIKESQKDRFEIPEINISGADLPVPQGELIVLGAEIKSQSTYLSTVQYNWLVLDNGKEKSYMPWPDGTKIFWGAGIKEKKFLVILQVNFLYVVKDDKGVILETVMKNSKPLLKEVIVGGIGPTPPNPTPVPPTPNPVATVTIVPVQGSIKVGDLQEFQVVIRDKNGDTLTGRKVNWKSSNTEVASFTDDSLGVAKGVSGGQVVVTATCEDKVGTAILSVNQLPLPDPTIPTGKFDLAPSVYKWIIKENTINLPKDGLISTCKATKDAYTSVSSSIAAGAYKNMTNSEAPTKLMGGKDTSGNETQGEINRVLRKNFDNVNISITTWKQFSGKLQEVMFDLYSTKKMTTVEEFKEAFDEINIGLTFTIERLGK